MDEATTFNWETPFSGEGISVAKNRYGHFYNVDSDIQSRTYTLSKVRDIFEQRGFVLELNNINSGSIWLPSLVFHKPGMFIVFKVSNFCCTFKAYYNLAGFSPSVNPDDHDESFMYAENSPVGRMLISSTYRLLPMGLDDILIHLETIEKYGVLLPQLFELRFDADISTQYRFAKNRKYRESPQGTFSDEALRTLADSSMNSYNSNNIVSS